MSGSRAEEKARMLRISKILEYIGPFMKTPYLTAEESNALEGIDTSTFLFPDDEWGSYLVQRFESITGSQLKRETVFHLANIVSPNMTEALYYEFSRFFMVRDVLQQAVFKNADKFDNNELKRIERVIRVIKEEEEADRAEGSFFKIREKAEQEILMKKELVASKQKQEQRERAPTRSSFYSPAIVVDQQYKQREVFNHIIKLMHNVTDVSRAPETGAGAGAGRAFFGVDRGAIVKENKPRNYLDVFNNFLKDFKIGGDGSVVAAVESKGSAKNISTRLKELSTQLTAVRTDSIEKDTVPNSSWSAAKRLDLVLLKAIGAEGQVTREQLNEALSEAGLDQEGKVRLFLSFSIES